jgi:transposase-like protein
MPVALTFDATFFGRGYGLLVYRACSNNIHWQEIASERLQDMEAGLRHLVAQGWRFSSVTIDGRKGAVLLINRLLPDVPVQMCLFHQKAIIRRYLTGKPKTLCGQELQALTAFVGYISADIFRNCLTDIHERYATFLKERNALGQFMHRRLRSALRSLRTNLPYLFTHQKFPTLDIPTTTNSCDGSFAHWKAKVKIHRGLRHHRRRKMIQFLLAKN